MTLGDLIEDRPVGVEWHTESETAKLLGMMSRVETGSSAHDWRGL
jgi:hypothetical protein